MTTPSNTTDNTLHAFEGTRELANQTLDQAAGTVRELKREVRPAFEALATKAQDTLRRGLDAASQTGAQAQESVQRYADATGKYIAQQPVKSVLIAAGAGALLAGLLMALRKRG